MQPLLSQGATPLPTTTDYLLYILYHFCLYLSIHYFRKLHFNFLSFFTVYILSQFLAFVNRFLKNFSVFSNFFRAAGYLNTMVRFLTNLATELAPANYCRIMRPFMENLQRIRRARNCTGDGVAYL